ncbi:MAG: TetR/AcrR family transcriptional regulator [Ilumatobacteraceae bacterium]
MVDSVQGTKRRRGRPPATDSQQTWRAILDSARRLFGERGYGAVTNKDVANDAGITTGALYHYVESKLDLYVAVDVDLQENVYARFVDAVASTETFAGKLDAVLEAAHDMAAEDETVVYFIGAVRTDMRRFPEISERLSKAVHAREQFFVDLVDVGIGTGEIDPADRALVAEFIRTILLGLTAGSTPSLEHHRQAIDGVKALLRGDLIRTV